MKQIDELSGRELDAAVAEAKGWIKGIRYWADPSKPDALWGGTGYTTEEWYDYDLPHYRPSDDISVAWELVEDALATIPHCAWALESFNLTNGEVWWGATFWGGSRDNILDWNGKSQSLPTAISRAYLKAKESRDGH